MGHANKIVIPSHEIWVELQTRVASQDLHYRSGDEGTAATNIAGLFATCRELMRRYPEETDFCKVTEVMLNRVIRPYTARWHGWITAGKLENNEWTKRAFREELSGLERILRIFSWGFGKHAATGKFPKVFKDALNSFKHSHDNLELSGFEDVSGVFLSGVSLHPTTEGQGVSNWEAVRQKEHAEIAQRRGVDKTPDSECSDQPLNNLVGMSFSGGGIRSATFSLGVVKILSRYGIFKETDYLSTVSGGGYLGTFLTSYLGGSDKESRVSEKEIFGEVDDQIESPPLRHLRNRSRYLVEGGLWTKLKIAGLVAGGVITNLLIMLAFIGAAVIVTKPARHVLWGEHVEMSREWFPATPIAYASGWLFGIAFLLWVLLSMVLNWTRNSVRGSQGHYLCQFLIMVNILTVALAVATGILALIPASHKALTWINNWFDKSFELPSLTVMLAVMPIILGIFARFKKGEGVAGKLLTFLFVFSGPLFYFSAYCIFCHWFVFQSVGHYSWFIYATIAVFVWMLCLNINAISPHHYYRDRLCRCYLVGSGERRETLWSKLVKTTRMIEARKTSITEKEKIPLHESNATLRAPYHLINAAVNLPGSSNKELRGRNSDFFLFSKNFYGSPLTGYWQSAQLEKLDPHVDLGTAMAISGAAVGSNMGRHTSRAFRFLLVLLNLRLGYWIPRPGARYGVGKYPGALRLFQEMTGARMDEHSAFLNISDGGHIENMGTYELIRRRCKFVVAVQGGRDPEMEFEEFRHLQRLVRIDFGVEINIDLSDISPDAHKISASHAALGQIHYPGGEAGWLLLIKLSVTGQEADEVLDYMARHVAFPHESTADQVYSEEQFEAYRLLGECAAEELFREELFGKNGFEKFMENKSPEMTQTEHWFRTLAKHFLSDNHAVFRES